MKNLISFIKNGNTLPVLAALGSLAGLAQTVRALASHQSDNLALFIAAQACLAALFFVPAVLAEMRDRQPLSVYRAMYLGK